MRIAGTEISNESLSIQTKKSALSTSNAPSASTKGSPAFSASLATDSTAISQTARLVSTTMSLPELDTAKVSEVQRSLSLGQFQIHSGLVATALIRSMLEGAGN